MDKWWSSWQPRGRIYLSNWLPMFLLESTGIADRDKWSCRFSGDSNVFPLHDSTFWDFSGADPNSCTVRLPPDEKDVKLYSVSLKILLWQVNMNTFIKVLSVWISKCNYKSTEQSGQKHQAYIVQGQLQSMQHCPIFHLRGTKRMQLPILVLAHRRLPFQLLKHGPSLPSAHIHTCKMIS